MADSVRDPASVEFCARARMHLEEEFMPRLRRAVPVLGKDDLWWRPNAECPSAGNLLLHLNGNVRQWILCGIGGEPDDRVRSEEFLARDGSEGGALLDRLGQTVAEACTVIDGLDAAALVRRHDIQVFEGVTALAAIFHVVEHFSWHTGQITWIAKMRSGKDLRYYEQPLE